MTPPPTTPSDPDFAAAAVEFKRGGWIVSILGGAGMIARLLLDDTEHPVIFWIKRIIAGAIVGCLCYFALWNTPLSGIQKSIILSTAGAGSPELMAWVKRKFSRGLPDSDNEEGKISKGKKSRSKRN